MRAKSDLTDQSECGLPYSVFGELAVKLVFTEAADQATVGQVTKKEPYI